LATRANPLARRTDELADQLCELGGAILRDERTRVVDCHKRTLRQPIGEPMAVAQREQAVGSR
jgi:hypothetical protein